MSTSSESTPDTPQATEAPQASEIPEGEAGSTEPTEIPDTDTEATEGGKGDREAAKLRRRAQTAEKELDTLRDRVDTMQRAEAERLAAGEGNLRDATDLWAFTSMDELLGEDGALDPEKVAEKVEQIVTAKPHFQEPDIPIGLDLGGIRPHAREAEKTEWSNVLQR